jgi:predicted DNA-binding WGR domain protein
MKHAQYQGRRVEAEPGAPIRALCPDCQYPVTLRCRAEQYGKPGRFFYRHVRGAPLECSQKGYFRKPAFKVNIPSASLYRLKRGKSWYNVLVETGMLSVHRVTRTWGRGASKGQNLIKDLDNRMDAEGYAQFHVLRLMRKGYDLVEWL